MSAPTEDPVVDDAAIRSLVVRLARSHPSGGHVIARAAILAEGADFDAVVHWIEAQGGVPEAVAVAPRSAGGLHGDRFAGGGAPQTVPPRRFILPPGALPAPPA